jgi:hypothetical protein
MRKTLLIRKLLVILTLVMLSITYSSYSYALEFVESLFDWDVVDHIKAHASTLGIAVETYVNGEFREDAGVLTINLDAKKMRKVSFYFKFLDISPKDKGIISVKDFTIKKVIKLNPKKVLIKGKDDDGKAYVASYSLVNGKLDFDLVIEGRDRIEVKNLSKAGKKIANKYLKYINIGWYNP